MPPSLLADQATLTEAVIGAHALVRSTLGRSKNGVYGNWSPVRREQSQRQRASTSTHPADRVRAIPFA
jgi:hypothetical protein